MPHDSCSAYSAPLDTSYQARTIRTTTGDGLDEAHIAYLDEEATGLTEANGGPPQSQDRQDWDDDGNLTADVCSSC